ncbi:hypothetical protein F0243_26910 [Vibrio mediterranei]|nr:hypothetical protein [Vibrio mediterranei]
MKRFKVIIAFFLITLTSTVSAENLKKTYTFYINYLNGGSSQIPSIKDINVKDILNDNHYLTKTNIKLKKGQFINGVLEPWKYQWARGEDKLSPSDDKNNLKFKAIIRPRGTLSSIPDIITASNREKFTYWSYIDTLIFFGGSAGEGTILAPDPQWIKNAHTNGVKIYGTVFLPPIHYGGSLQDCTDLGTVDVMSKLIDLASGLNFDGWLLNVESYHTTNERKYCVDKVNSVLNNSIIRDKLSQDNIDIIKYIGSQKQNDWISDHDISSIGFIEKRPSNGVDANGIPFNKGEAFISEYSASSINSSTIRPYLLYPNAMYFDSLDVSKYKIPESIIESAERSSKHLWEGMLGLNEVKTSDRYNWNGLAQFTKKRIITPLVTLYKDWHYENDSVSLLNTNVTYNIIDLDSVGASSSSMKIEHDGIKVKACTGENLTGDCDWYFTSRNYFGDNHNDKYKSFVIKDNNEPAPLVRLYSDWHYEGVSVPLISKNKIYNVSDLNPVGSSVSSLVINDKTIKLKACTETNLAGSCDLYFDDNYFLGNTRNDKYKSFIVEDKTTDTAPLVRLYKDWHFEGPAELLMNKNQIYNVTDANSIGYSTSSLRIADNIQLKACTGTDLTGDCDQYYTDSHYLSDRNDKYHSFVVEDINKMGSAVVFRDHLFEGRQYLLYLGTTSSFPPEFEGHISSIKLLKVGYKQSLCIQKETHGTDECTIKSTLNVSNLNDALPNSNDNPTLSVTISAPN